MRCCLYVISCKLSVFVCVKIQRKVLWCCYQQSPSNKWCSCSTSYPRCLSLFWPIWAAAAQLDESLLASLPLWFVSYTLGELKIVLYLQRPHLNFLACVKGEIFTKHSSLPPSDGSIALPQMTSWHLIWFLTCLLTGVDVDALCF